ECLEAAGRYEGATYLLVDEFHRVLNGAALDGHSSPESDAQDILERLTSYGNEPSLLAPLAARLDAVYGTRGELERTSDPQGRSVRILVVGGDERQAVYDSAIEEELKSIDPAIGVKFIHPGWSGHWSGTFEEVR